MFKKFNPKEDISGSSQVKSSQIRSLRTKICELYPGAEPVIDQILPKKEKLVCVKCREHVTLYTINQQILFVQSYDGPLYPTLRLIHQYPTMLSTVQVDRGAIKFVMKGADIMCPGLTSKGGKITDDLKEGAVVAIFAEGKEHALGIGQLKMSGADILRVNKDVGIENVHFLGDPIYRLLTVE